MFLLRVLSTSSNSNSSFIVPVYTKKHTRDGRHNYLHEDLHAIANVIFGSVKIILQDVQETKFLAIVHFYNGFLLFCLHCLINKG